MGTDITKEENVKTETEFRLGHRPALDGLRGIFVLLVLTVHSGVPFMQGAGLGVDGFFVLSGFLITCLLLQEWQQHGSISLKRFYIRRALRLLPALYALLAAVSVVTFVSLKGVGAVATERGVILSFLYSSNLGTLFYRDFDIGFGLMSHSWSLALEEQFYLVWPIVLIGLLLLRVSRQQLVICIGMLAVSVPLWRVWLMSDGYSAEKFFLGMGTRADTLLTGCALGALFAGGLLRPSVRVARLTRWLTILGIGIIVYLIADPFWLNNLTAYYVIFLLIAVCMATPILHVIVSPQGRMARLLSWKPLVQVGVVSYGVYLWHNPVFHLLHTGPAGWLDLPVQFARLAVTALFVIISYRYIESPMLRLKERFSSRAVVGTRTQATQHTAQSEGGL